MKKLWLVASLLGLTACSSTALDDSEPVEKRANLKHICIAERVNPIVQGYAEAMQKSLQKKNISAEIVTNKATHCQFVLRSGVKADGSLYLKAAKVRLTEKLADGANEVIGSVVYRQVRGEERQMVQKTGLQGQTDRIVAELFKHY